MEYPFRLHVRMNGVLSSRDPRGRVNDKTGGIDAKTRSLWLWLKMPQRPPLRFLWVEANRRSHNFVPSLFVGVKTCYRDFSPIDGSFRVADGWFPARVPASQPRCHRPTSGEPIP